MGRVGGALGGRWAGWGGALAVGRVGSRELSVCPMVVVGRVGGAVQVGEIGHRRSDTPAFHVKRSAHAVVQVGRAVWVDLVVAAAGRTWWSEWT